MASTRQTENFFRHGAHTAHSSDADAHPLRRPGVRARLAALTAGLMLFTSAAMVSPAFSQAAKGDAPSESAVIEQVVQDEQAGDTVAGDTVAGDTVADSTVITTPDNFAADVLSASTEQAVLLYIYSPDCHYCEQYGPALEIEADIAEGVKLVKLNVDEYPEFTWNMFEDMQSVPTVALYAHGFFINKNEGAPPEGKEFEAAQALVNYAGQVWQIVGDQLEGDAPDNTAPETTTPKQSRQPNARTGM